MELGVVFVLLIMELVWFDSGKLFVGMIEKFFFVFMWLGFFFEVFNDNLLFVFRVGMLFFIEIWGSIWFGVFWIGFFVVGGVFLF